MCPEAQRDATCSGGDLVGEGLLAAAYCRADGL